MLTSFASLPASLRSDRERQSQNQPLEHLAGVSDPRTERTRRHKLLDILAIAICAMICGAEHWNEIAELGHASS